MSTLNAILKELKDVPVDRLDEVYEVVHALAEKPEISETKRKKLMSFAGCWSDMSDADFKDFQKEIKQIRAELFNRNVDI